MPQENGFQFIIPPMPELTVHIPLKEELRPYQKQGVAYGIEKKRFINGDDMGLGKTFEAIATAVALEAFPLLIICPAAVKENWKREFKKFSHIKAIILDDSVKDSFPEYYRVGVAQAFIVNYESVKKYFVDTIHKDHRGKFKFKDVRFKKKMLDFFKGVIVDEIQKLKDSTTNTCKYVRGITYGKPVIMGLTGTAVINNPFDLAAQLLVIQRLTEFGGVDYFNKRYCSGRNGASHLIELNYRLNNMCYFRRNKTDPDIKAMLPDKYRQIVMCDLSISGRKEYDHAVADLLGYIRTYKQATDADVQKTLRGLMMVRINVLKNISARGKLDDAFDFIESVIASGRKIVVFAHLKEVVQRVVERFPNSVKITGDENHVVKQANIDRFQSDPRIMVAACNLQAAGLGIDGLQNIASEGCFLEFGWHAAVMDQAEDRIYRSGQHSNVMWTYFLGRDTIDVWNYELIESKRKISNTITGAEDDTDISFIHDVINLFTPKTTDAH